jgi:hypothetical protein
MGSGRGHPAIVAYEATQGFASVGLATAIVETAAAVLKKASGRH